MLSATAVVVSVILVGSLLRQHQHAAEDDRVRRVDEDDLSGIGVLDEVGAPQRRVRLVAGGRT